MDMCMSPLAEIYGTSSHPDSRFDKVHIDLHVLIASHTGQKQHQ